MGKGGDPDCKQSVDMGSLLSEELSGAEARAEKLAIKLGLKDDPLARRREQNAAEALKRAQEVEDREREFHEATLDQISQMHKEGTTQDEIDAFIDEQELALAKERNKEFNRFIRRLASQPDIEYTEDEEPPLTPLQSEGRRMTSVISLLDGELDGLPPSTRFQAEFFSAPEFLDHWKAELSDAGLDSKDGYQVATGVDAEDCWRDATRKTLGLSMSQINDGHTLATWVSPSGNVYDIEIMSEFSKTALFDLILRVRDQKTGQTTIVTNQQKSTKRITKRKDEKFDPEPPVRRPRSVSVTLAHMSGESSFGVEKYKAYSLEDVAREFQIRLLATNTITETSPLAQQDDAKKVWFAHHTSRISQPAVHRAIAAYPDLHKLFKPVATRAKFTDPKTGKTREKRSFRMVAEIPVPGMDKPVLLTSSIYLSDEKKGRGKQPWQIDRELTGARDGSIILSIPDQGWIDLHRVDTVGIGLLGG